MMKRKETRVMQLPLGKPRVTRGYQELEEARKYSSLELLEGAWPLHLDVSTNVEEHGRS